MFLSTPLLEAGRFQSKGSYHWPSINRGDILSAVPEVLGPGSILLSNCIDGRDEGIKTMLIQFAAGTKLGELVIALQGRNKIQNGLDVLRKWLYNTGINFVGTSVKWHSCPHSPRTVPRAYLVLSKYLQCPPCGAVVRTKCDNDAEVL